MILQELMPIKEQQTNTHVAQKDPVAALRAMTMLMKLITLASAVRSTRHPQPALDSLWTALYNTNKHLSEAQHLSSLVSKESEELKLR